MSNASNNFLEIPIESVLRAKVESPLRGLMTHTLQFPFLFGAEPFNQVGPDLYSGNILTARYDGTGVYDGNNAFPAGVQWDISYVDYMEPTGIPGKFPTSWTIWYSVLRNVQGGTEFIMDTPAPPDNYAGITPEWYGSVNGFVIFPTASWDYSPYHPAGFPGAVHMGLSKKGAACWVYAYVNCTVSRHTINGTSGNAGEIMLNPATPGNFMQSIVPPPNEPVDPANGQTAYDVLFLEACRCDGGQVLVMWLGLTPAQLPTRPFSANSKNLFVIGDPNFGGTPITNDATRIDTGSDGISE